MSSDSSPPDKCHCWQTYNWISPDHHFWTAPQLWSPPECWTAPQLWSPPEGWTDPALLSHPELWTAPDLWPPLQSSPP